MELRAAPGELTFASIAMLAFSETLASSQLTAAPPRDADGDFSPKSVTDTGQTEPPDDEPERVTLGKDDGQPGTNLVNPANSSKTLPPNSAQAADDALIASAFSDETLQSALLSSDIGAGKSEGSSVKTAPLPDAKIFVETPSYHDHQKSGGGGATNIAARGRNGVKMGGGVAMPDAEGGNGVNIGGGGPVNVGGGSPVMAMSLPGSLSGYGSGQGSGSGLGDGGTLTAVKDDSLTVVEDHPLTFNPLINDTGGDAAPWIINVSAPQHGTAVFPAYDNPGDYNIAPTKITYTPDKNSDEDDSFTYTITDGHGHFSEGNVNIDVTPVNDSPTFYNPLVHTEERTSSGTGSSGGSAGGSGSGSGGGLTINLLSHTDDPEGGQVTLVSVDSYSYHSGQVSISPQGNEVVEYIPSPYYHGPDSFSFQIKDPTGPVITQYQYLQVVAHNPNFNDPLLYNYGGLSGGVMVTMEEGGSLSVNLQDFCFDDESPLTFSNVTVPPGQLPPGSPPGSPPGLTVTQPDPNATGSITLQASAEFIDDHEPKIFTVAYDVVDAEQRVFHGDVLYVNVTPINNDPVAVDDIVYASPGSTVNINPLVNDTDPEEDQPFISKVITSSVGTATYTAGTIALTVGPNATTNDTIQYTIKDGYGGEDTGTVKLKIIDLDAATIGQGPSQNPDDYNIPSGVLSEELENEQGAYLPLNEDDDNWDKAKDDSTNKIVAHENDLLPLIVRYPTNDPPAQFRIRVSTGVRSEVRLFKSNDVGETGQTSITFGPQDAGLERVYNDAKLGTGILFYVWGRKITSGDDQAMVILEYDVDGDGTTDGEDHLKVKVFDWSGPIAVPGYTKYTYTAIEGLDGATSKWIGATGGTVDGTQEVPDNPTHEADRDLGTIFWNTAGPAFGGAIYRAASGFDWLLDVNIVQIKIEDLSFVINNGVHEGVVCGVDNVVVSSGNQTPPKSAMEVSSKITVTGPVRDGVMRGVEYMDVGFIQLTTDRTLNVEVVAYDAPGLPDVNLSGELRHYAEGNIDWLDAITKDCNGLVDFVSPWYDAARKNDEGQPLGYYSGDANTVYTTSVVRNLETDDTPTVSLPLIFRSIVSGSSVNPINWVPQKLNIDWAFSTFIGIRTHAPGVHSEEVDQYTQRARGKWSFNGTGTIAYTPPNNFDGDPDWTAAGAGVTQDEAMAEITDGSPVPEWTTPPNSKAFNGALELGWTIDPPNGPRTYNQFHTLDVQQN